MFLGFWDLRIFERKVYLTYKSNNKQVAGAGFGGPLLNLKWLPCDQNKYLLGDFNEIEKPTPQKIKGILLSRMR